MASPACTPRCVSCCRSRRRRTRSSRHASTSDTEAGGDGPPARASPAPASVVAGRHVVARVGWLWTVADPGERIGAYEVVRFIARGGMATVYEAFQPTLQRSVALKQLDLRSTDPRAAERFINESRLSASFNHPNIVTVFDFFEHDGVPYIAMEYLPRGSLRPLVGGLSQAQVFGVLQWTLGALAHAEAHGVAHRDLKPENLLITRTGEIKIADFGIAKAYHQATMQLSATAAALGTPPYMAPEQAMAQPVGPYTDLYAVGIITYEMLS